MTFHGHVQNGNVVLDGTIGLPDGTPVTVIASQPPVVADSTQREIPSLYERMKPIIGIADHLPPDASQNIDHYLYGHPKKSGEHDE
jgi:hypothetical protein